MQNGWTDRDVVLDADSCESKEPCVRRGAHWHRLANTTDRSVSSGDGRSVQQVVKVI